MNRKGQQNNPLMTIILLAMILFIGLAFATSVANTKSTQTDKRAVTNESDNLGTSCYVYNLSNTSLWEVNESDSNCNITVDNWYSDWRASESKCNLGSVAVTNSTGTLTLTEGTDYNLYEDSGLIQFLNTSKTSNDSLKDNLTYTDYNYCGSGYLTSSGDRGILSLIPTMMILVLIGAGIIAIRKVWINE